MEVTLLRGGGIIPVLKKSAQEVDLSEQEMYELIDAISLENDDAATMRDNTFYQLMFNNQTFYIDLEKVPEKYRKTFKSLKDNLQIVKPGQH